MSKLSASCSLQSSLLILENTFVVFALSMLIGVVLDRSKLGHSTTSVGEASLLARSIGYSIYGLSCLLALSHYRQVLKFAFKDAALWILVITAFLSTIWSELPQLTFARSVSLLAITFFGAYLGVRYSLSELFHLLRWALALIAISSVVFAIFMPADAFIFDERGSFLNGLRLRGILGHPNLLGRSMVLSVVVWQISAINSKHYRLLSIVMAVFSAALVALSNSVSSTVVLIALCSTLSLLWTSGWQYRRLALTVTLFLLTIIVVLLAGGFEVVPNLANRDESMGGRTELWLAVWEVIVQRPWLGYGYEAFWTGANGPASEVWSAVGWKASYAHNALLDIWLNLGIFGLTTFLLSLFRNFFIAIINLNKKDKSESIIPLIIIIFLSMTNLVEGQLISTTYLWTLYVFMSTHLSIYSFRLSIKSRGNECRVKTR
jgi:O-antigen ligase